MGDQDPRRVELRVAFQDLVTQLRGDDDHAVQPRRVDDGAKFLVLALVAGRGVQFDRDRMAVSLICSIFSAFGSGLASDRFGILFHNRGSGFTLEPGHPNEAGGGKRPMEPETAPGLGARPAPALLSQQVTPGWWKYMK